MSIKEIKQKTVNVQHKILQVPAQEYLQKVNKFSDPYSQEALQSFTADYLNSTDDQGIIGMVRYNKSEGDVVIDAAIRYPERLS
ncbi:hypothetical protein PRVXH_000918 [Proteinivorax hydrogeniformans]|uniref:Uncharacterized protein n=1 Tax=Proteinivorax hydrogeniformans TaxID=1826727 RepID=A0AAU8HW35_9FIRM